MVTKIVTGVSSFYRLELAKLHVAPTPVVS